MVFCWWSCAGPIVMLCGASHDRPPLWKNLPRGGTVLAYHPGRNRLWVLRLSMTQGAERVWGRTRDQCASLACRVLYADIVWRVVSGGGGSFWRFSRALSSENWRATEPTTRRFQSPLSSLSLDLHLITCPRRAAMLADDPPPAAHAPSLLFQAMPPLSPQITS